MEAFIALGAIVVIWAFGIAVGVVCWGGYKMWRAMMKQYKLATWPHNDHCVYYTPRERLSALVCAVLLGSYIIFMIIGIIYFSVDFLRSIM